MDFWEFLESFRDILVISSEIYNKNIHENNSWID